MDSTSVEKLIDKSRSDLSWLSHDLPRLLSKAVIWFVTGDWRVVTGKLSLVVILCVLVACFIYNRRESLFGSQLLIGIVKVLFLAIVLFALVVYFQLLGI